MHLTRASMAVRGEVTWPHKVVYIIGRKPAAYQNMSLALFVQGYIIIMKGEEWTPTWKM